jgi:hypothetical protein
MSASREQIQEQIKVQGDLVRKLKTEKESKEKVRKLRNVENCEPFSVLTSWSLTLID